MYKKTGRNITVSRDVLMNCVINRLQEYDNSSPVGKRNMNNPYIDVIYAPIEGGKTVQVPSDIHEDAIQEWTQSKHNVDEDIQRNESNIRRQTYDNTPYVHNNQPEPTVSDNNLDINNTYNNQDHDNNTQEQPYERPINSRTSECRTCNIEPTKSIYTTKQNNYTRKPMYYENTRPYVNDDTDDNFDEGDNRYITDDMYKNMFYIVLFVLLYIIIKNKNTLVY